jgi:hypothetical protein
MMDLQLWKAKGNPGFVQISPKSPAKLPGFAQTEDEHELGIIPASSWGGDGKMTGQGKKIRPIVSPAGRGGLGRVGAFALEHPETGRPCHQIDA